MPVSLGTLQRPRQVIVGRRSYRLKAGKSMLVYAYWHLVCSSGVRECLQIQEGSGLAVYSLVRSYCYLNNLTNSKKGPDWYDLRFG